MNNKQNGQDDFFSAARRQSEEYEQFRSGFFEDGFHGIPEVRYE